MQPHTRTFQQRASAAAVVTAANLQPLLFQRCVTVSLRGRGEWGDAHYRRYREEQEAQPSLLHRFCFLPHSVFGGTRCAARSVMMACMQHPRRAVVTATIAVMFSVTLSCLM